MAANVTLLPALKAVTNTDQGGILAIAASMGLVLGIVSILIRIYVRIECNASFAKDDWASYLSMAATAAQTGVVFLAISHGFGRITSELTAAAIESWQLDIYVSDILYILGMWLTKCSVALLLVRLSQRDPAHLRMAYMQLIITTVYVVISLLVVCLRCNLSRPWLLDGTARCYTDTFTRWSIVTAMDIATELSLLAGSLLLVRGLHLPWSKKSVVVLAYAMRLPLVVMAALRLYYMSRVLLYLPSSTSRRDDSLADSGLADSATLDPSLSGIPAAVCTQVELGFAVAAATMPCLKPFMSALNTQYGGGPVCIVVVNKHSVITSSGGGGFSGSRSGNASRSGNVSRSGNASRNASRVGLGSGGITGSGSGSGSSNSNFRESRSSDFDISILNDRDDAHLPENRENERYSSVPLPRATASRIESLDFMELDDLNVKRIGKAV